MTRRKKNPASRSKAGFEGAIRTSNVFYLILVVTGNQRAAQDRCAVGSGDEARQLGGLLAFLLGLNLLLLLDERSGGPSFLRHVLGS